MGVVYVLSNPAHESFVKIGIADDLEQRMKDLDNTSVPLPFRCEYAIEVDDNTSVEKLLHDTFDDHRVRPKREFFEIAPQRVIAAMKLTGGRNVTPKGDVETEDGGVEALNRAITRRSGFNFEQVGIPEGSEITYADDETITAKVLGGRFIEFEGEKTTTSAATLTLKHRDGFTWVAACGPEHWKYGDELLAERRFRFEREEEDRNSDD